MNSATRPPGDATCTVYFDGLCPVCTREVAAYRRMRGGAGIQWIDAARCDETQLRPGLVRADALQRLYVQGNDGTLLSGAAAFVEIWRHLPAFAWAARLCSNRYALAALEFAYNRFLFMRRLWRRPAKPATEPPA